MKYNYSENEIKHYEKDLDNEIVILKLLSFNKNSVKYYGNYDKENEKIIVMEICDMNLKQFIQNKGTSLTVEEIKAHFLELNNLFKFIQNNQIIHRDLKLENILVKFTNKEKTKYILKLADYGISKFNLKSNNSFSGLKGTTETVAPEIILQKNKKYDSINDIFSLGIILYQLSHNLEHPYDSNIFALYTKYSTNYEKDDYIIRFYESIKNNDFKELLKEMLKLNPKNRLNWNKYFSHPFFK